MNNTTNAVRQVLMNELGLTRENVREEIRKIVEVEAAKVVSSLVSQGHLERVVREEFRKLASNGRYDRSGIERICVEAAKKEAETFMRDNLRFVMPNTTTRKEEVTA
jgi:hypothetical protein